MAPQEPFFFEKKLKYLFVIRKYGQEAKRNHYNSWLKR